MCIQFFSTRLIEITLMLLNIGTDDSMTVFGYPDAYKVRFCMMLLKYAALDNDLFQRILDKFCQRNEDDKTLRELRRIE